MPIYVYECSQGHVTEELMLLGCHREAIHCPRCKFTALQVMTAPILVSAQPECRYDSPIDGAPITTWAQRRNDLDKHNCRPYDPLMKQDSLRHRKEADEKIEKNLDDTVERVYAQMPAQTRAQLSKEMQAGVTAEPIRSTSV